MNKFKVGDKVRLKYLSQNKEYYDLHIKSTLNWEFSTYKKYYNKYKNKTLIIDYLGVQGAIGLRGIKCFFIPEEIVKIEIKDKFKIILDKCKNK